MRLLFADTFYWIAILLHSDRWHQRVIEYGRKHPNIKLVTTDGVLDEMLNYFAERDSSLRKSAAILYQSIVHDPNIDVIPYISELRQAGFQLYQQRPDKGYSFTDCISMVVMQQMGITQALTHDKHFAQEGFRILFHDTKEPD
jgi:uncharacterized protein